MVAARSELLLLLLAIGCTRRPPPATDRALARDAADAGAVASHPARGALPDAGLTWTTFDGAEHCASLRTILGYLQIVPAWSDDAGYLRGWKRDGSVDIFDYGDDVTEATSVNDVGGRTVRGKVIPSAFASCKYSVSTGVSRSSASSYGCLSGPAPTETEAAARYDEIVESWRRCLKGSGLREVRSPGARPKYVTFRKSPVDGAHITCDVSRSGATLEMSCGRRGDD
jgi:hypothetical protein